MKPKYIRAGLLGMLTVGLQTVSRSHAIAESFRLYSASSQHVGPEASPEVTCLLPVGL